MDETCPEWPCACAPKYPRLGRLLIKLADFGLKLFK
jgi:hypothetical protein